MKLGGQADRIELKPETGAEKEAVQRIIDGEAAIYWGDSEFKGGALVLNSAQPHPTPSDVGHHSSVAVLPQLPVDNEHLA